MRYGSVFAALLSCVVLVTLTSAKKKASAPKWKSNSMPYHNMRFKTEMEGNDIKIDCKTLGHPKPHIRWMKDGVPIQNSSPKLLIKKYGLTLSDINADMSGNYTCLVENKHGALEWTFILNVQAKIWPLVVEGPSNITQMVGSNVAFQCRILNDPKATIRWQKIDKKKGSKRPKNEFLPDGEDPKVLMLEDVTKEDEGEYRCMAGNIMGLKYSSAWLTIIEPATVATVPPHIYDPQNPNVFDFDHDYYTTTRRPRKNNKNGRRKKNRKNKKNRNKNSRPRTTTPLPTEPSSTWIDSTPTSSTFNFFNDVERSTLQTKIWTYPDDENDDGIIDNRYNPNPNMENENENGKMGSAKGSKEGEGSISAWKIYTIVGAVGGVVLLIGLVAITIALCCPKQEGGVYKSTPV